MVGPRRRCKAKNDLRCPYILNDVKQIKPEDYYAPIVGEFELLVLLALVRLGNGAYGAAIRREIQERTGRDVSVGTAYMALGRLEEKKMIASYVGLPTAQQEPPHQIGSGQVVVAGHGNQRPAQIVSHGLDEAGLAAPGGTFQQDRQSLPEGGFENSLLRSDRYVVGARC